MKVKDNYEKSICCWPNEDRPRERLFRYGEHTLSDSELLAILLHTGVKGKTAVDLARNIVARFKTFRNMSSADPLEWKNIKGIGEVRVSQIKAAIEIGRRLGEDRLKEKASQIKSSLDIVNILMPRMRDLKKEVFKVVLLDAQNRIIEIVEEDEGTVNFANPIIREIFQKALQKSSVSVICVHNHPSGTNDPSPEDRFFTRKLFDAGKIMQIKVLDHIIIGRDCYYSFADNGME